MVRRTKQETEHTRLSILAAARETFLARGVSGTTLETVAAAAGVTRGAIYWHFANKKALFDAMRAQVRVPLIDRSDVVSNVGGDADPLCSIERLLLAMFESVTAPGVNRQTFEIMAFKCEYVGEFANELQVHRRNAAEIVELLARLYGRARRLGQMRPGIAARAAAVETMAFILGLIRLNLLGQAADIPRPAPQALIAAHVGGRRAGR